MQLEQEIPNIWLKLKTWKLSWERNRRKESKVFFCAVSLKRLTKVKFSFFLSNEFLSPPLTSAFKQAIFSPSKGQEKDLLQYVTLKNTDTL